MANTYYLPVAARLQYKRDAAAVDSFTNGVSVNWARSFEFFDMGYADGLIIAFGSMNGSLTATDVQLATGGYVHNFTTHGATPSTGLWLPGTLAPVAQGVLDTTDISLYFDPDGAAALAPIATWKCLALPEQISPQLLQDGLVAAQVAYRWTIKDDTQPTLT